MSSQVYSDQVHTHLEVIKEVHGQMHRSRDIDGNLLICFLEIEVVYIKRSLNTSIVDLKSLSASSWRIAALEIAHQTIQVGMLLDGFFDEAFY